MAGPLGRPSPALGDRYSPLALWGAVVACQSHATFSPAVLSALYEVFVCQWRFGRAPRFFFSLPLMRTSSADG